MGLQMPNLMVLESFSSEFSILTDGWTWEIQGFLDAAGYVHPIDTDTKVISTVFERLSSPVVRSIARQHGYSVEISNQTTYPDFTLTLGPARNPLHRIAIDVKSTYESRAMGLTLGGYNSFLRSNTKNILHPYDTYGEHWILGFVYSQRQPFQEYDLNAMPRPGQIPCPYGDVFVFVRDKHAICGLRAGSGNTKNIGSIKVGSKEGFATAKGPFLAFRDRKSVV